MLSSWPSCYLMQRFIHLRFFFFCFKCFPYRRFYFMVAMNLLFTKNIYIFTLVRWHKSYWKCNLLWIFKKCFHTKENYVTTNILLRNKESTMVVGYRQIFKGNVFMIGRHIQKIIEICSIILIWYKTIQKFNYFYFILSNRLSILLNIFYRI